MTEHDIAKLQHERDLLKRRAERLERLAKRRRHSITVQAALFRIADITAADLPTEEFFKSLHDIVRKLMYAENFYIALVDPGGETFSMAYFVDTVDAITAADLQKIPISNLRGTLTGYVLRTGEAHLLNRETMEVLRAAGEISDTGADSNEWLGASLQIGERTIGVMAVQTYDSQFHLHREDRKLLHFVSRHIATALERKQKDDELAAVHEELEQRVALRTAELQHTMEKLQNEIAERNRSDEVRHACYAIADRSVECTDLNTFYASTHEIVGRLMDARNLFIALYDRSSSTLSFPFARDSKNITPDPQVIPAVQLAEAPFLATQVISTRKPLLLDKAALQKRRPDAAPEDVPTAWLGVPLVVDDIMTGALVVQIYDAAEAYTADDQELLTFVASHVATAMRRRRDTDELRRAHDEMQQANDALEQRIEERTQALSTANRVLEKLLEQRKSISEKLAYDAYHDALTGLPNRSLLRERLDNTIKRFSRSQELGYALLFLDLDRFKIINDSLGHLIGDRLLTEVAQRLQQCVRPGDTVARLGGDEFCILLDTINDVGAVETIATRVLERIGAPYLLGDQRVYTSTSIGIALSTEHYSRADLVLRDADAAMYEAKALGKNQFVFFDPRMHQDVLDRLKIESALRHAISRNEIQVVYQPIYDLKTGCLRAFEALARWNSATLGPVSPVQFIPLAEETGLINEIGEHVLTVAAKQVAHWQKTRQHPQLSVSVNLSGRQLTQADFLAVVQRVLRESCIAPGTLKLEITESLLIHNFDVAQAFLSELQGMGIEILLDDFGTGYSSLNYLHQFPLNTVKIDREFVKRIGIHEKSRAILLGIRELAKQLELTLVAEGIENPEQLAILQSMNIEMGQGYLFGAPMPMEKALTLLNGQAHPAFPQIMPSPEPQ